MVFVFLMNYHLLKHIRFAENQTFYDLQVSCLCLQVLNFEFTHECMENST